MKWPLRKLGELTSVISSGATPLGGSAAYLGSGPVLFIRSQNVQMGTLQLEDAAYVSEEIDKQLTRTRVQFGDVLLNITGASIGRVAPYPLENGRANVNQHVCVIRPHPDQIDFRFLAHYLATPAFQVHIQSIQAGGTRQALNFSQIARFEIPVPPVQEQRRIAAILDQAEALRAKRRQALAKLDTLTQSLFLEMFGDPVELSKSASALRMSEVCVKITDGTHHSPEPQVSGIPYITAKHVDTDVVDFDSDQTFVSAKAHAEIYKRCDPKPGDILYIKDGATTGKAAINHYSFEFSMLSSLALLRPDTRLCSSEFLCAWLNHPNIKDSLLGSMAGAAIRRLTLSKIKDFRIFVPKIEEQERFSERMFAIRILRAKNAAASDSNNKMFASLQHRAFRGDL